MNRGFNRDPRFENNPNKRDETKLDRKTTGKILKRLFGYVMKEWPLFICAIILTFLSNQLSLLGPRYSGDAIDAVAAGKVNLKGIVTDLFDFDNIQEAMDKSVQDKANIVKAVVKIN